MHAQAAIEYAAAYQMSKEETASILADALLKGLLASHHDGRAASAAEWNPTDFLTHTQVRGGNACRFHSSQKLPPTKLLGNTSLLLDGGYYVDHAYLHGCTKV